MPVYTGSFAPLESLITTSAGLLGAKSKVTSLGPANCFTFSSMLLIFFDSICAASYKSISVKPSGVSLLYDSNNLSAIDKAVLISSCVNTVALPCGWLYGKPKVAPGVGSAPTKSPFNCLLISFLEIASLTVPVVLPDSSFFAM